MIVPVGINRDEHGYWTHPALTRSGCETPAELRYWLRGLKPNRTKTYAKFIS